ncbi:MAG: SAM-dependent methyltransferase [Rhodobacteraceae bacterium]|nr:MAG: SAM-dependent methyltransferase [Paracoccaceae bacterium]
MRLSWNEIRTRAATFSTDWSDAHYEKGETQSFYNEFFEIFGIKRRTVARYEESIKKLNNRQGFIDLFWPAKLIVEQKSAGRDLSKAATQAGEYFDALKDSEKPRYQLVCDFQNFELLDRDTREITKFALSDLHEHVEKFGFIMGVEKRNFKDQDPVNIEAAELVGKLHDALKENNYTGHKLEAFLTRLVFCLFADDTGIFEPRDIFLDFLETRTKPDGSDTGPLIAQLFQTLNTPENQRQTNLDEDLAAFPYVNGSLFEGGLDIPAFDSDMRAHLIAASQFNWSNISPAIFGSLFQSVMNAQERRALGAHYTTEKNIMKVIEPLFLDDLRAEFEIIKARKNKRKEFLRNFQDKLSKLTFFDPACGCGNFLIIAYRELRLLEIEVLKQLNPSAQRLLDAQVLSKIDVDQFYGIEVDEFPARIAETALWMMDHIMNSQLSLEFGQVFLRIPLKKSPHILHGDALDTDWADHIDPKKCSYIMGNPPFIGAKFQSPEQREQVRGIANLGKLGGTLDFVCAWFLKAGAYVQGNTRIAFVSTNSITQGEQVAQLWPILFDRCKLEIAFAHRTFAWGSEARGKANVHVVIIGFDRAENARAVKRLFSYETVKGEPEESLHKVLSPYLFDASGLGNPHLVVANSRHVTSTLPKPSIGSQVIDAGHYIFEIEQKEKFVHAYPEIEKYFRPYFGARDFIYNSHRWVLYLKNISPNILKKMPMVIERIKLVREFRQNSKRKATLEAATRPTEFALDTAPQNAFLVLPRVTTQRRDYAPFAFSQPPAIPSDAITFVENISLPDFALLTSAMHMAWLRNIGGRLKSDYRYSIGLVYNTFPLPIGKDLTKLEAFGQAILDARANHPDATLADLYDPDVMPVDLRKAHIANDRAVDKLYSRAGFKSKRDRVEHLFAMHENLVAPMLAKPKKRR